MHRPLVPLGVGDRLVGILPEIGGRRRDSSPERASRRAAAHRGRSHLAPPRMDLFVRACRPIIRSPRRRCESTNWFTNGSSPHWRHAASPPRFAARAFRERKASFFVLAEAIRGTSCSKDRRSSGAPSAAVGVPSCSMAACCSADRNSLPNFPAFSIWLRVLCSMTVLLLSWANRRERSSADFTASESHDRLVEERVTLLEPRYRTLNWGRRLSNGT